MTIVSKLPYRKLFGLSMFGVLLGAVLAVAAPPTRANAADACVCNDLGSGSYSCNFGQTACLAGSEICQLTCK